MKLEIGKTYRSRSGKTYAISSFTGITYGHIGCPAMWYEDGHCLYNRQPHSDDLIEEVKEDSMQFLTDSGYVNFGEDGPLKVGDRVRFFDGSYSCYATKGGFKTSHPAMPGGVETGVILATGCKLPALYSITDKMKEPNDTIVFTDSGKTYFTRLAFLKRI